MNNGRRLIPVSQRLGNRALQVPVRTFFGRGACGPWVMVESQLANMDRQFTRLEREMNAALRDWGLPASRIRPFIVESSSQPGATRGFPTLEVQTSPAPEAGKPGKYCVKIDFGEGFAPEDIKVNLNDKVLTIHAKMEKKSDDGRIYQEFTRSFTIPDSIKPEEVKSLLTPEGILTIEAPLPETEAPKPKEIPISVESK